MVMPVRFEYLRAPLMVNVLRGIRQCTKALAEIQLKAQARRQQREALNFIFININLSPI